MEADRYISKNDFYTDKKTVGHRWNMGNFHYHNSYEIYYLEKGRRRMLVQDRVYELCAGDVLLLCPEVFHRSMHISPHTRINIIFTDNFVNSFFSKTAGKYILSCFETEFIRLNPGEIKNFLKLYSDINEEYKNNGAYFITLAQILRLLINAVERQSKENIIPNTSVSPKVNAIIEYISKNYNSISSIEDIADACFLNKSYLCRLFKKEIDMTVFEYLNNIKIHNACDMLCNTKNTITDIAVNCGFSSVSYFSVVFKEIMKCTPSQFRKNVKE